MLATLMGMKKYFTVLHFLVEDKTSIFSYYLSFEFTLILWLSNFSMHQNHMKSLFKTAKPHLQSFWFNRALSGGQRILISNTFVPTDADTASQGISSKEPHCSRNHTFKNEAIYHVVYILILHWLYVLLLYSPNCSLSFRFVFGVFDAEKFLISRKSNISTFSFIICVFCVLFWNLPYTNVIKLPLVFFLKFCFSHLGV